MNMIVTALTRYSRRHALTIDRGRIILLTVLFCKAPMMAAVVLGISTVIKVARMKMPIQYTTWE